MSYADALAADNARRKKEAEERNSPQRKAKYRFWLEPANSCFIVILDESLNGPTSFYRREHNEPGEDGKWGNYSWCFMDMGIGPCPKCRELGKKGQLVNFLTILAFQEYETGKEGQKVKHAYRHTLLPVSGDLATELLKKEAMAVKRGKTLRGMTLMMERSSSEKSFRTGFPIDFADPETGEPVSYTFATEEDIEGWANNPEVKNEEGKVYIEEGEHMWPMDYASIFGEPNIEEVFSKAEEGRGKVAGSRQSAQEQWAAYENQEAPADGEEIPGLEKTPPKPPTSRPPASMPGRPQPKTAPTTAKPTAIPSTSRPALVTRPAPRSVGKPEAFG